MFRISTRPPYFIFLSANRIVKIVCHFQRCDSHQINVGFNTTLCNFHTPLLEVSRVVFTVKTKIIHQAAVQLHLVGQLFCLSLFNCMLYEPRCNKSKCCRKNYKLLRYTTNMFLLSVVIFVESKI